MIRQYQKPMANRSVFIIIMVALSQFTLCELKLRFDCEPCMLKLQQFNVYCPPYESCQWYCQEKLANCIPGTKYHCARSFKDNNTFMDACVREIYCPEGEEPWISIDTARSDADQSIASVFCKPCFKKDRFNSRINTQSATFSKCPSLKTNLCTEQEHKIDCGYITYQERTKTDGYCRCDARKGYAAQSDQMCFYENEHCFKKNCPDGEELLLNYTCAMICPTGFMRTDASDNCQQTVNPPTVTASVFTTVVEDEEKQSSTEKVTDSLSSPQVVPKNIPKGVAIVLPSVLIGVVLVGIIWICLTIYITEQVNKPKAATETTEREELETCVDKETLTQEFATSENDSNHEKEDADSISQSTTTRSSTKLTEQDHFCKEIWQEFCNYVFGQERFPSETFLKKIETNQDLDLDSLKKRTINHDDPYFCHEYTAGTIKGYTALKKSPDESPCLYTWISYLLYGNGDMTSIIRLAAARFALQNFDDYVAWLTNVFVASWNSFNDATFFFKIHGVEFNVYDKSKIKIGVQLAFADLVKEIVNAGSGNGPFYVKFLSGALNCNIVQHYANDSFAGREVRRIPCLLIKFPELDLSDRKLHIYWMKSDDNYKNYRVLRLYEKVTKTYV